MERGKIRPIKLTGASTNDDDDDDDEYDYIMMISDSEAVMVTTTFVQRCGGVEVIIAGSRPWPGRTAIWRMIMLVVIT